MSSYIEKLVFVSSVYRKDDVESYESTGIINVPRRDGLAIVLSVVVESQMLRPSTLSARVGDRLIFGVFQ